MSLPFLIKPRELDGGCSGKRDTWRQQTPSRPLLEQVRLYRCTRCQSIGYNTVTSCGRKGTSEGTMFFPDQPASPSATDDTSRLCNSDPSYTLVSPNSWYLSLVIVSLTNKRYQLKERMVWHWR